MPYTEFGCCEDLCEVCGKCLFCYDHKDCGYNDLYDYPYYPYYNKPDEELDYYNDPYKNEYCFEELPVPEYPSLSDDALLSNMKIADLIFVARAVYETKSDFIYCDLIAIDLWGKMIDGYFALKTKDRTKDHSPFWKKFYELKEKPKQTFRKILRECIKKIQEPPC
uniref:Uncharacterized protein n=1 Tax=viral metagenome TaxID=1070528 RepID=A0A6H1ZST7_9ZZZZ